MENFEIKADPKIPYHYLIGVGVRRPFGENNGEYFLKYFLEFHHEDVENVRTAIRLMNDRMFPSGISKSDAIDIAECREVVWSITAMRISAQANNVSIHHFSSKHKLEDKFFEDLVKRASTNEHDKKLLKKARI